MKVTVVILCGGSGTRLFPLSTADQPKQFLALVDPGETMIQATVRRARSAFPDADFLVVTNAEQARLVREQLPGIAVLIEPEGRNTAPAIGLAAMEIAKLDPERIMVVLPCDHYFGNEDEFVRVLSLAAEVAIEKHRLVTIGIKPEYPHPQLGYVKAGLSLGAWSGVFSVERFHEKPGTEKAAEYLAQGDWYWNSGMFVWRAGDILSEIDRHLEALGQGLKRIDALPARVTDERFAAKYHELPSVSIDVGIMQKTDNRAMVMAFNIKWKDIGSWPVLSEFWPVTGKGNRFSGDVTDVMLTVNVGSADSQQELVIASEDCIVYAQKARIVTLGLQEIAVLEVNGRIVVCNTRDLPLVGEMVKKLPADLR